MPDSGLGSLIAKLGADLSDLKKGLLDGKSELSAFKGVVETTATQVKSLLKFAGISLGFYELISQAKAFGESILEVGAKTEVLRASAQAIAAHYQMSAGSVELYVDKLKEAGIEQERAFEGINQFLKAGISIDQLPQLAEAAKVLGASMGMPMQEAFSQLITGITKGTPKQLAAMVPGIKEVLQSMSSETKKLLDSTIISGTEKSEILLNATLAMAQRLKGETDSISDSYYTKLNEYKVKVAEVKESLFEFVKPIAMAVTNEEIKSWDDFYTAIGNSRTALREAGEAVAVFIGHLANGIRNLVSFVANHKELVLALVEVRGILAVLRWTGIAAGAEAISGVLVKLGLLRAALSGPWTLAIAVTLVGVKAALDQAKALSTTHPEYVGGAEWVPSEEYKESGLAAGRKAKYKKAEAGAPSPFGGFIGDKGVTEEQAKAEAERAHKKGKKEHELGAGAAKGGGAKAEHDTEMQEYLRMIETIRQAELKAAESGIEILKAEHATKKAELDKQLEEGLIDGKAYYAGLQQMENAETQAALALIEKKKTAQAAAYKDAQAGLAAEGGLTDSVRAYRAKDLEVKNTAEMAKLNADAARVKLEGERRVTDELKRQVELKKEYTQKTEDLNLETSQLLGAISSQEATLQRLYLDWQRAKAEAVKAGASPEYFQALEASYQAKKTDTQYGGYASTITNFIGSLSDSMGKSMQDLKQTANGLFKSLFTEALKPSLEQLKGQLTAAFKQIFGDAGSAISGAVMGVIGLIGMLATSSTKSSWSGAGAKAGVQSHEAVRGVISGDSSIDVAKLSNYFADALGGAGAVVPILAQIEVNTRSGGAPGGQQPTNININGVSDSAFKQLMDKYTQNTLMKAGSPA